MILVADSGSTKTDWCLVDEGNISSCLTTAGLNPCILSEDVIKKEIADNVRPNIFWDVTSIYFYGSGVRADKESLLCDILREAFPSAVQVEAHSDMLGAARALCGSGEGIACILGTGSNSCVYDGNSIIENTPALGYILGDEGSGAVLGRLFLNSLYKRQLPESLAAEFEQYVGLTLSDIINKVYREPMANRFLASLSPFVHAHISIPEIHTIVTDNFRAFFRKNIAPYKRPDLPVNALGSIAYYYSEELREAAELEGFTMGMIVRSPFESKHFISFP